MVRPSVATPLLAEPDPKPPPLRTQARSAPLWRRSASGPTMLAVRAAGWTAASRVALHSGGHRDVDDAIEEALLGVVGPGIIAASMAAAEQATNRRDRAREALGRDLEDEYALPLTALSSRYDAADPANRLVAAAKLEARWNQALARVVEVEQDHGRDGEAELPRRRRSTRPRSPSLAQI